VRPRRPRFHLSVNLSFPSSAPTPLTVTRLKAQTAQPNKLKVSHICSSMSDDSISSCCAVIFVTGRFPLMIVEATSPMSASQNSLGSPDRRL
jgi:hypothetical protein